MKNAAKVALGLVLLFLAYRWYVGYQAPEIKGMVSASPTPLPVSSTLAVEPTAPPSEAVERPAGAAVGVGLAGLPDKAFLESPSPPVPVAPPPTAEPAATAQPEGPTETEVLAAKIRDYRARYGAAKARVEALEREVADLTERASRFIGGGNSGPVIEADAVRSRLGTARDELTNARSDLARIEESARRDGVSYGQLY